MSELSCSTSYIQLLANKEKHEGRLIDFRAVMHWNSKDDVYIFPFNESRRAGVVEDMIRLDGAEVEKLKEYKVKSGAWVRVGGRFKAKDNVEFQRYFGVITEIFLLIPMDPHDHIFNQEGDQEESK